MFESIGKLITIGFWAIAILVFLGGICVCISKLINGYGFDKFWAIVTIVVGIFTFSRVHAWFDSVPCTLFATGAILFLLSGEGSDQQKRTVQKDEDYNIGDALVDAYVEHQVIKEAVKEAIRESKD